MVPGYLGRILGPSQAAIGTCFQVAGDGVLVTAWHVLDALGAGDEGATVLVDDLAASSAPVAARVARVDPLHDLAVLLRESPLPATVADLWVTDAVRPFTELVVAGVSQVDDPGHEYRWLSGTGSWKGGTTRDDQVPLGLLSSSDVLPGMSGGPVRRLSDDGVVGVISGRYNTADNWLRDSVWVARVEDLLPLLTGLADLGVHDRRTTGSLDLILEVGESQTRLTGGGRSLAAAHDGPTHALGDALDRLRRARSLLTGLRTQEVATSPPAESTPAGEVGRLLAAAYLPSPIADELRATLAAARSRHAPLSLGLRLIGEVGDLPWEALWLGGEARPLALDELVRLYRRVEAPPVTRTAGPLRILVAISSPVSGGSGVLDYEQELRSVLKSVRGARAGHAEVKVVHFATTAAIHAALRDWPAHVLHLSGHGGPGVLELEDDNGAARPVSAGKFLAEAVPPGRMPAVIALAGCYTNAATATGDPSFATSLLNSGARVVIATQTSITDIYSTRVFARVYGQLAVTPDCDMVAAVAEARTAVQRELARATDPRDQRLAALDEWSVLSVLSPSAAAPIIDPSAPAGPSAPPPATIGVLRRDTGEVVGRRWEQRRYPTELMSAGTAGMVLHGLGGVGKTTLADELIARLQEDGPELVLATIEKRVSAEELLDAILEAFAERLYQPPRPAWATPTVLGALRRAGDGDLDWPARFAALRRTVLAAVPTLIVLDNFEDNLTAAEPGAARRPREDVADLLTALVAGFGRSRLLITSRYRFVLPGNAEQALAFKLVMPLSHAETLKLAWALPHLDRLDDEALEQLWRAVGGHPRCLEYVDALLSRGQARFADVRLRLAANAASRLRRLGRPDTEIDKYLREHDRLDAALAEAAALASDDVLLDDLLAGLAPVASASKLLLGAGVYRVPVDRNALVYQVGQPSPEADNYQAWLAARRQIVSILKAAGAPEDAGAIDAVTPAVRAALAPHLAVKRTPPVRPDPDLDIALQACAASSLLTVTADDGVIFMHRWTASELVRRAIEAGRTGEVVAAHGRAAEYWKWRVASWPQASSDDAADLREAHYHHQQEVALGNADAVEGLATVCYNLSSLLSRLGRRTESLTYSQQAVDLQRSIAAEDQPGTVRDLGGYLSNHGLRLADVGRRHEALTATVDAVDIFRGLVVADPPAFERDLAMALSNVGTRLAEVGRWPEALAATAEGADIYRRLAADQADVFDHGLAMATDNLGSRLADLGRWAEACAATAESVEVFRRLAATDPAATEFDLAMALSNLGTRLPKIGRNDEALVATAEAVDIQRRLAAANPAAFEPFLAGALGNLGNRLQEMGREDEALAAAIETAEIFQRLAAADPAAFAHNLAMALGNLGTQLVNAGRYEEALAATSETVEIFGRLAAANPVFDHDLAMALGNLGLQRFRVGQYEEALTATASALDIYRSADAANPGVFEQDLGWTLHVRALTLTDLGRGPEALAAVAEAVEIYERAWRASPESFAPELRAVLTSKAQLLEDLDRPDDAAAVQAILSTL